MALEGGLAAGTVVLVLRQSMRCAGEEVCPRGRVLR